MARTASMHDVVSIGSALVDILIASSRFELKEEKSRLWLCQMVDDKIEVEDLVVTTGGGATNTAVGFAKLGFRTGIVSELGQDAWAELIIKELQKENVDTSCMIQERKEETGGSVILSSYGGERTILVHRGAASMLDPQDLPEPVLSQASWIHLSSIQGRLATLQALFSILGRSQRRLSWNPGKKEIELLVSGQLQLGSLRVAVLFVNQKEWTMLEKVQEMLHQQCQTIVVTRGKEGGVVYQSGKLVKQFTGTQVEAKNATGAGDSFATGFVGAALSGLDLDGQIEWGKANSGSVVQQIGAKAGLLTRAEIIKK